MPILLRNVTVSDPVQSSSAPVTYLAGTNSSAIPDWALRKMYDDTLWDTGTAPYDPPAASVYATEAELASGLAGQDTYAELTDVDLAGLADGQVPVWNATAGKWEPGTPAAGGGDGKIWIPAQQFEWVQGTPEYITVGEAVAWRFPDTGDHRVTAPFRMAFTPAKFTLYWACPNADAVGAVKWQVWAGGSSGTLGVSDLNVYLGAALAVPSGSTPRRLKADVLAASLAVGALTWPGDIVVERMGDDAGDTEVGDAYLVGLLVEPA